MVKSKILLLFSQKKTDITCWIIMILVALTATNFLSSGIPKLGADDRFPLAPSMRFIEYLNIWSHNVRMLGGAIPMRIATLFPSVTILSILENLKTPVVFWQQCEFFLLYFMALLGVYYFVWYLTKRKGVALAASLFYITNPFCLNMLVVAREGMYLWAGYPLMMATLVRGFLSKKSLKPAIIFSLSTLLATPGVANPPTLAVVYVSFLAFFIYYLFFEKTDKKKMIVYGLLCALFYLLVNLWWLFPFLGSLSASKSAFVGTYSPVPYAREASAYTSILGLFRLSKRGDIPPLQFGYYGFHFLSLYDLVTFLPTLLIMLSPILVKKNRKLVFYYLLLIFGAIFLAKGTHPPFGFVYEWLLNYFPGFAMFRSPVDKFSMFYLLGYSFLIGIVFEELIERMKNISKKPLILAIYLAVSTPLILLFRTGLKMPYEFKYGNILVFSFLFLIGAYLFGQIKKKKLLTKSVLVCFLYFIYIVLLDRWLFGSPLANWGLLKILGALLTAAFFVSVFPASRLWKKETLISTSFVVVAFPFIFTNVINHLNGTIKLSNPEGGVPSYYYQAKEWLDLQKEEFRLLSLPSNAVVVNYRWPSGGGFNGYDFVAEFFGRPTIDFLAGDSFTEPIRFQTLKWLGGVSLNKIYPNLIFNDNLAQILRLMNVKYLLLHNDYWWEYYGNDDPKRVAEDISLQKDISLSKSIGKLDFYEVNSPLPHIYASPEAVLVNGYATSLTNLSGSRYLDNNPVLIISDQQTKKQLNNYYKIGGRVLMENSLFTDLAIDYLKENYGILASYPGQIKYLKIDYAGEYEIWASTDKLREFGATDIYLKKKGDELPEKTVNVNSYTYDLLKQRWVKVTQLFLNKGEYTLMAPELIISARLGKVVIVPKILREKEEKYLSNLIDQGKLKNEFIFSPQKYLLNSQKYLYEKEAVLSRDLYTNGTSAKEYLVNASFRPKQEYSSKDYKFIPKFTLIQPITNFQNWVFTSSSINYQIEGVYPLKISVNFKRDSSSPEEIRLEASEKIINLEEFPYLILSSSIEDEKVQGIAIKVFVDTNNDDHPDDEFEIIGEGSPQNSGQIFFGVLKEAKSRIHGTSSFRVVRTQVILKKNIGVNCSRQPDKQYQFTVNYLSWFRTRPPELFFPLAGLTTDRPGLYEYIKRQKVEDYVGYVYQPSGNFGFKSIENIERISSKQNTYLINQETYFQLNGQEDLPIAINGIGEKEEQVMVETIFGSSKHPFSSPLQTVKLELLPESEINVDSEKIELVNTKNKLKGIFLSNNVIKSGILSSGTNIKSVKITLPDNNTYEYGVSSIRIGRTVNDFRSIQSTISPEILINSQSVKWQTTVDKENNEIIKEAKVNLKPGAVNIQSNDFDSRYTTNYINIFENKENKKLPNISFRKITYSKYLVNVKAESPFWLVFSESFDSGWKAYRLNKSIFQPFSLCKFVICGLLTPRKFINSHFLVNGYANGWYMEEPGNYQIIIEYSPQIYFEIGIFVSVAVIVYLLGLLINKKKKL